MKRINLSKIDELKGLSIITKQEELQAFLSGLRQDYYSPKDLKKHKFPQELDRWIKTGSPNFVTFFSVYTEGDTPQNDYWGHQELIRCIAVLSVDGKVHLFQESMYVFQN